MLVAHRSITRRDLIGRVCFGFIALPLLSACGGAATSATTPATGAAAAGSTAPTVSTAAASTAISSSTGATTAAPVAASTAANTSAANSAIAFWHWGDQSYLKRYQALAAAFHAANPAVAVNATLITTDLTGKLLAAVAGGTPPESFVLDFQLAQGFAKKNILTNIDARVHASRLLKLDQYGKLATGAMSYRGKWVGLPGVGIPGGAAPNLIFYNEGHFQEAGLPTPYDQWKKDAWTWDTFLQACQKLVKRDSTGKMTTVPLNGGMVRLWLNAAGGQEFDDVFVPTKSLYDQAPAIKALQFEQDLRYKYRVQPVVSVKAETGQADDQAFMNGRLSMSLRWTTGINLYRSINNFKWGMAPYPKATNYATDYTAAGLAIPTGAKHVDAAWSWIEWASSPDGQKVDAATTTGVPFDPGAQQVFTESLKQIPQLTTPDTAVTLINDSKISFLRLLSVDQDRISSQAINPPMAKLWKNQASASTTGQSITQLADAFLKANPQG